jgi:hypothetical protein
VNILIASCDVVEDEETLDLKSEYHMKRIVTVLLCVPFSLCALADNLVVERIFPVDRVWSGHSVGFSLHTAEPYQYVAYYDANRQLTVAMRRLDREDWSEKKLPEHVNWDSHHYITMAVDRNGFVHVSGNIHSDPLVYFRTTEPYDIATLERVELMVGRDEQKCTYPQFLTDSNGNLLFMYRDGKSGDGVQLLNRYDTEAKDWTRLSSEPLFDGLGEVSCYPEGPVLGPDGYFHLVWVWRVHGGCETNHQLSYAKSKDLVQWESAAGESIQLPITPRASELVVDPVPVEGGMINESTIVGFDTQGRAIVSYHKFDEDGHTQIFNARAKNGAWSLHQTSDWQHRWYFSGGGTIENDIDLGPVTVLADGGLGQGYKHVKYGSGVWLLDEETLKPRATVPGGTGLLDVESNPRPSIPGIAVRWKADTGVSPPGGSRFFLRWEAMPVNRDKVREDIPPASSLQLYELRNAEFFDLGMSCIHDGYFE